MIALLTIIGFLTVGFFFALFQIQRLAKEKKLMQKKIEDLLFETGKSGSKIDSLNETLAQLSNTNENLKTEKQYERGRIGNK